MPTFGERLKSLRIEKDLTQEQLGEHFGMKKSRISQYELDKRQADDELKKLFADYFNVSIDYLIGRSDIRNPYNSTDKISSSLDDDKELAEFWNVLKEREDLKLLFKQTKDLAPKDIKQIMRIIKAIEDEEDRNDG